MNTLPAKKWEVQIRDICKYHIGHVFFQMVKYNLDIMNYAVYVDTILS